MMEATSVKLNQFKNKNGPELVKVYEELELNKSFRGVKVTDKQNLLIQFQNNSRVGKAAKIMNRYNRVQHLTQDITWKSDKTQPNITNKSQEVSPFPSGDHKAAMNRRESMSNTIHK